MTMAKTKSRFANRCIGALPGSSKAVDLRLHQRREQAKGRRHFFLQCMSPEVCRFLDAGNGEWLLALGPPASKKRQGTKSREVGHRLSSEHYGDLILTPAVGS